MKALLPVVLVVIIAVSPLALGQEAHRQANAGSSMPCVEVQIGQDVASQMSCVNETLRRLVEHEHEAPGVEAPITAASSSNEVGTFNLAASQQMMGNAFGVSAHPQRPSNTFTSPLVNLPRLAH